MNRAIAASVIDAAFESELGGAATYKPPGGVAVPVTVVFESGDNITGIGNLEVIQAGTIIDLRASELTPARNGRFTVDGDTYRIQSEPVARDGQRLVWRCSCLKA